jgi:hypothetical protein
VLGTDPPGTLGVHPGTDKPAAPAEHRSGKRWGASTFDFLEVIGMLNDYPVYATIATGDLARARSFYEGTLGFTAEMEDPTGGVLYGSGGTRFLLYLTRAPPVVDEDRHEHWPTTHRIWCHPPHGSRPRDHDAQTHCATVEQHLNRRPAEPGMPRRA